jgi:hypothetical protein
MNTIGIVYSQYWLQGDLDSTFTAHLNILKEAYYVFKEGGCTLVLGGSFVVKQCLGLAIIHNEFDYVQNYTRVPMAHPSLINVQHLFMNPLTKFGAP